MRRPTTFLFGTAAALLLAALLLVPAAAAQDELRIRLSPDQPQATVPVEFSAEADRPITQWAWTFGDGATSNESTPRHTFSTAGDFRVRLEATFADANTTQTNLTLHVDPAPPTQPTGNGFPTWLYWTMPLIVGFVLFSIALMVLVRGQPVIYNRVFFLLYAASALKSFTEFVFYLTHFELGDQHAFIRPVLAINRAIGFLYPHFFLWFVLVFPRPLQPWLKNGWRGSIVVVLSLPFFVLEYAILGGTITRNLFNAYVSILALVALGLLVYHAWETDSREERHRIRLLAVTFFLIVLSTVLITLLQWLAAISDGAAQAQYDSLALASGLIFVPLVEIVGCILLMYAILRYQLLGVELFLRRVTRATTFALSIGFVFVVVSNSVEQLFQVKFLAGVPLDFLIAGFLSALLMYPIQKGAERVANRLFPNNAAPDHLSARRMEIYEAQLRYALLDGLLKEKELTMLHALRDSLGLRADELKRVAQRFPGVNPGLLLARAAPSLRPA
jgi:hypothetical protein